METGLEIINVKMAVQETADAIIIGYELWKRDFRVVKNVYSSI
jgi:hypothetical protein